MLSKPASDQRCSIATLRPSTNPVFRRPSRKAAIRPAIRSGEPAAKYPTTAIAACCARAASGHAAAAPPSSVMNSRRLKVAPRGQSHAPHRLTAVRVLERGQRDVNCDQLFWLRMSALGPTTGSKPEKLRIAKWFPVCLRKHTYLPILERLPPPTLRERRHRGLARRPR